MSANKEYDEMKTHAVNAVNNWLYSEYKGKFKTAVENIINNAGYKDSNFADALFEATDEAAADYYSRMHNFSHSFEMSVDEMMEQE